MSEQEREQEWERQGEKAKAWRAEQRSWLYNNLLVNQCNAREQMARTHSALWVFGGLAGLGLMAASLHALNLWETFGEVIAGAVDSVRDVARAEAELAKKADDEADDKADDEGGE